MNLAGRDIEREAALAAWYADALIEALDRPKRLNEDLGDIDFDDFDDFDEEEDEWEQAFAECGLLPPHLGGGCQLVGTEYCDFECPFRDNPEWITGDLDQPKEAEDGAP